MRCRCSYSMQVASASCLSTSISTISPFVMYGSSNTHLLYDAHRQNKYCRPAFLLLGGVLGALDMSMGSKAARSPQTQLGDRLVSPNFKHPGMHVTGVSVSPPMAGTPPIRYPSSYAVDYHKSDFQTALTSRAIHTHTGFPVIRVTLEAYTAYSSRILSE